MATVIATPGASNANSFLTVEEAQAYWDTRVWFSMWDNSDDQEAAIILATRTIMQMMSARREFVRDWAAASRYRSSKGDYFIVYPTWTGAPASTTQALAWPRIGMFDRNGNAIPSNVVPQDLKDATAELAGQMSKTDRLIDSDIVAQGISSVKAGSVSLTFRDGVPLLKALPDVVLAMLVPSWLTEMTIQPKYQAEFDVIV